jgi:exportin-2 (importin alpha re-exporter)
MQIEFNSSHLLFVASCVCVCCVKNEGEADHIPQSDRDVVKRLLIDLMISTPSKLQLQLAEAVNLIANQDFPHKWTQLVDVSCTHCDTLDS